MVARFVSDPIDLPPADAEFSRADLIFYDVDHSGPSYEARVYLDDPDVTVGGGREPRSYAGAFHIFGHGGCFGDEGHCDVPTGPSDPFDMRTPHQLTPQTKLVTITEALRAVFSGGAPKQLTVTVVAETPGDGPDDVLAFDRLRLVTYK
jgi:tyrosinase